MGIIRLPCRGSFECDDYSIWPEPELNLDADYVSLFFLAFNDDSLLENLDEALVPPRYFFMLFSFLA